MVKAPKLSSVPAKRPRGAAKPLREVFQESISEMTDNIPKEIKVDTGTGLDTQLSDGTVVPVPRAMFQDLAADCKAAGIQASEGQIAEIAVLAYKRMDKRMRGVRDAVMKRTIAIKCKYEGASVEEYKKRLEQQLNKKPHTNKKPKRQAMMG